MSFKINLSDCPKKLRGEMAENMSRLKLNLLGFHCREPRERHTDIIAVKKPIEIPIQVKQVGLKSGNRMIHIDDYALKAFKGLYTVLVEEENADDRFLFIGDDEMRTLIEKKGLVYDKAGETDTHRDRWWLYISKGIIDRFANDSMIQELTG